MENSIDRRELLLYRGAVPRELLHSFDRLINQQLLAQSLVTMKINEYDGCKSLKKIQVIESDKEISSKDFFDRFIATRTAVMFNNPISDKEWKVNREVIWTNDYLRSKVPKEDLLKIEFRNSTNETYGKGNEMKMSFHTFLDKIEKKEQNLYLTTQELEYDEEGQPYVMTAPALYLRDDFPLIPRLFEHLIISNINIWYGQTDKETTTGLHHDYHDNLYIMLKGEKTITLYSPADTENLYTVGKLVKVHPNGRVNYEGQFTHPDGRDLKADKAFQAALKLEDIAKRLESEGKGKSKKSKKTDVDEEEEEQARLEISYNDSEDDEIDAALDAVLDAEMGSDFDEDDEDDYDDEEDEDDSDDEGFDGFGGFDDNEDDEEEEEEEEIVELETKKKNNKRKLQEKSTSTPAKKEQKKGPPNNFSQVDTSRPMKELKKEFPLFPAANARSITVTIKAGQMLFIPCGWWHEVRSRGSEGHIAFNYWFHPPDQRDFEHPYSSPFWPKSWENRKLHPCRSIDDK